MFKPGTVSPSAGHDHGDLLFVALVPFRAGSGAAADAVAADLTFQTQMLYRYMGVSENKVDSQ